MRTMSAVVRGQLDRGERSAKGGRGSRYQAYCEPRLRQSGHCQAELFAESSGRGTAQVGCAGCVRALATSRKAPGRLERTEQCTSAILGERRQSRTAATVFGSSESKFELPIQRGSATVRVAC
uniref:(northern house mosquito) hypothetical protein n=1 Tax=Culex pipiens TaxID=7175 RepID=A0A8D8HP61_CULPI